MSFGGGSSGGQQTTTQSVQPYAAAQPALNQIISEVLVSYIIKVHKHQVMLHLLNKHYKVLLLKKQWQTQPINN